jgi:hypothetical protein
MATHVGDIFFDAKINRKEYDRGLRSMGAGAGKMGASIGRKLAVGLASVGFAKFIKDATKAGASLNAMGTIIDASLPHMTKQVDEFAKRAGAQFGLSETQAKGFVGKFASMASAMGYTEEQAYKMSTALTGLAGDVASYYHISQDEAFAKLGAVFTGETESLKQLGVIMTQNALDTFALEQGYGRTTAQMSELEKTTLRYNFVLDRLRLASGDFAKYANTWSGSIATIKLNWANFMATMGQGIINILLPLLQLIARISNALSALASRFLGWTKGLRGIKSSVQGAFGKKTQKDLKSAGTGIGNVGSGLGGAGKQAKGAKKAVQALKRELLGFDKITKLTGENGTTSGGTGTGGGGGVGGGGGIGDLGLDDYDMTGTAENYVDKFVEKFKEAWAKKDFTEIGALFASKLNSALEAIPWSEIKATSEGIGKSIATFLNGVFGNRDLWKNVGGTFAETINTVISAGYGFVTNFNWGDFGQSIADALNGALEKLDSAKFAKGVSALGSGLSEAVATAISGIDWSKVVDKMAEFISNVDWGKAFSSNMKVLESIREAGIELAEALAKAIADKITKTDWGLVIAQALQDALKNKFGIDVDLVGLLKKVDDSELDPKQKILKGETAQVDKQSDEIPASSKNTSGWTATFTKKDSSKGLLGGSWGDFSAYFSGKSAKSGLLGGSWGGFSAYFSGKSHKSGLLSGAWGAFTAYFTKKQAKTGLLSGLWGKFTAHFTKKKANGGVYKNGRWSPIQRYASGGSPTTGEMFIARERGAELVGRLKGHTAVMNNDQIVASVSSGVAKAISSIRFQMQAPPLASYSSQATARPQAQTDTQQMVILLQSLLATVNSLDLDVQLDGESIKQNTVRRINNHTRATGQLELII